MNLITKTAVFYVVITLVVFGLGGIMTFNILREEVDKETDYYLKGQAHFIFNMIEQGVPVNALNYRQLHVTAFDSVAPFSNELMFSDTLVEHPYTQRLEPHRMVKVKKRIEDKWYAISLFESVVEDDDLSEGVFKSLSWIFAILVVLFIISSIFISNWIFRPFHKTLKAINQFKLQEDRQIDLGKTPILEFTQLNRFISQMMQKMRKDYLNLKEFTENASHELQTPTAIAKGKLEILIESQNLDEQQVALITSAYQSLDKLAKLNKTLALLSKIENDEFVNFQEVNLSMLIENKLRDFQELFELKAIRLQAHIQPGILKEMDKMLAEILISNLIQNAIKHNRLEGIVEVTLDKTHLKIKNTGNPLTIPTTQLFERFKKDQQSGESLGLGLAIVKKICEASRLKIAYTYEKEWHTLLVKLGDLVNIKDSLKVVANSVE